jgi:methyl-accepting chemotaxis protein
MNLRQKIAAIGAGQLVLIIAVLFVLYYRDTRQNAQQQYIEKARSVILTTESMREEMAGQWARGVFSAEQLREWASRKEIDKVVSAVPVVTAWRAAQRKAQDGGYEFRVPKFHPRNADNEPTPVEAQALKALEAGTISEYVQLDQAINAIRYYRPIKLTSECLLCHGDPADSEKNWGNTRGLDPTGVKMENWNVGEVHGAFEIVQSLDQADADVAASLQKAGGLVLVLIVAGCSLFYVAVRRWISRPIDHTVEGLRRVAAGDLTVEMDASGSDEISELRREQNQLVQSLRQIMQQMSDGASHLAAASAQLDSTSKRLTDGAERTTQRAATVASASEELSVNSANMANSSERMSANIKEVADAVEQLTQAITEVARSAEQAASVASNAARLADDSNDKVTQLGQAAEAIGKVIEVIQDIAEQTNLLALNATIEAARAGEAGKGFAVVATEVKDLARQTAEATEDIQKRIDGIQLTTQQTIEAIGAIGEVVQDVNKASQTIAAAVEEQSMTTRTISQNVSETANAAGTVSINVAESAQATREVTVNIAEVDATAKRTAEDAVQAQHAGSQLLTLAKQLQAIVSKFKVR